MAKSPRAKRWVIECTTAGRFLAYAHTGRRGPMTGVGTFGSVEKAVQACETAIAAGPVRPHRPKPKPQPSIAERVREIVGDVKAPPPPLPEKPPRPDWMDDDEETAEPVYPWL